MSLGIMCNIWIWKKFDQLSIFQVKRRADGVSKWFGFVTFTSAEAAEQVVSL